jgi:hypothetical protein
MEARDEQNCKSAHLKNINWPSTWLPNAQSCCCQHINIERRAAETSKHERELLNQFHPSVCSPVADTDNVMGRGNKIVTISCRVRDVDAA